MTAQTKKTTREPAFDPLNQRGPSESNIRATLWTCLVLGIGLLTACTVAWGPESESDQPDQASVSDSEPPTGSLELDEAQSTDEVATVSAAQARARLRLEDIPFNGARAYEYLKQICAIGKRISGTEGMRKQQELVAGHFQSLGGQVEYQQFQSRHPLTKKPVHMANMIIRWHPERKRRILLCAHYDTRPLPDEDPSPRKRLQGTFIGANDGASGVALLMEMGHWMPQLESPIGVDFLLVDGEELVYGTGRRRQGTFFLGSRWFAQDYVKNPPAHKYQWGVLLDMVADADLQIHPERNSYRWPESRPLVHEIWETAERLGVHEFHPKPKHEVKDDHLMLRNVGRIPTIDIIDFDYGRGNRYWHTEADRPNKCSALSLAKVGWVVLEWLKSVD